MAETLAPRKREVIAPLTGVRAFAALWVVLHHLHLGPGRALELPGFVETFCAVGYLGVDLFGFLSGFVIAHNYAERLARPAPGAASRYLWLRLVRIGPLHWLALGALLAARIGLDGFDGRGERLYRVGDFAQQVLLVHGWGFGRLAWNLPSWTVSSEWLCYLLFPLAAPWIAGVRDGRRAIGHAAATFATTAVVLIAAGHPDFNATTGAGVWRIAGEFLAGCWLQRAWAAGFGRGWPWARIVPLLLVAAVAFGAFAVAPGLVACFGAVVLGLAYERGFLARLFSRPSLVFLGDSSYAIYIVHWPVLRLLAWATPVGGLDGAALWREVAWQLAAIVAIGIAAHVLIDDPIRRRLRGWVAPV